MASFVSDLKGGRAVGVGAAEAGAGLAAGLRIALFSGNYNCVRDGANKALNRLVAYLLEQGAAVRVYSPTVATPAFPPAGDLVSVPSVGIPGRTEYRFAMGLNQRLKEDIRRFGPTHVHLSCPDRLGGHAQAFARELALPVVASLHTRFETYLEYYGLGFFNFLIERRLRTFYSGCDYVLAPNEPSAADLRSKNYGPEIRIWGRGVDRELFNPRRRSREWRLAHGYGDDEAVVLFFGRLVREKGIETFADTLDELARRGHKLRPLIVGDGPERKRLAERFPKAVFTGHLEGPGLAQAIASADILINPSVTEAFGNVNLEAMASGLAVVSADVGSARALIRHQESGLLVSPVDPCAYADAAVQLIRAPSRRKLLALAAVVASTSFSWNEILNAVVDVYREARAGPMLASAG